MIRRGPAVREVVPLEPGQRFSVGRSSSNRIVVSDDKCSRQHCELFAIGEQWMLRDLGSRNGTFLGGEPIEETPLHVGDIVEIGDWRLELSPPIAAAPAAGDTPLESDSLVLVDRKTDSRYDSRSIERTIEQTRSDAAAGQPSQGDALARLYVLAEKLAEAADVETLAEDALHGLCEATGIGHGCLALSGLAQPPTHARSGDERSPRPGDSSPGFTNAAVRLPEAGEPKSAGRLQPLVDYLAQIVRRTGDGCRFEDTNPGGLVGAGVPLTGAIAAPIRTDPESDVIGAICLFSLETTRPLTDSDLDFALTIATRVARRRAELLGLSELIEEKQQAEQEAAELRQQLGLETDLVGESEAMERLRGVIGRIAPTEATVLIRGESGVGKELVARAVHFNSDRRGGPMVCVNCAALTETLLESELFGHEKGAFTGATARKSGKFETADKGTIFLDEVGEMSPEIQAKFLRVLEGHPFERVGGSDPIRVNVRVVCATNRDLEQAVEEGGFRQDLYFRLHVIQIDVPPLRERFDDIPEIAQFFVERYRQQVSSPVRGFTPEAMQRLMKYPWPGNVRELKNVVERAVILAEGEWLGPEDITLSKLRLHAPLGETAEAFRLPPQGDPFAALADESQPLDEIERRYVEAVLRHTEWNKSAASRILQIERTTLDRKIKKYDLTAE